MRRPRPEPRRPHRPRPEPHPADVEGAAVVLDYMPFGYHRDPHREHREKPVAQAIGVRRFTLLDGLAVEEVELLEEVSLARELIRTVVLPPDPVTRRIRRTTVYVACMAGVDRRIYCIPVDPFDEEIVESLRLDLEKADPNVIVLDRMEAMRSVAREKGLPEKFIVVPRKPLRYEDLSDLAKRNLEEAVAKIVRMRERIFVEFFNIAEPINIRLHSLSLLKGVGKRTLLQILRARQARRFQSFEDVKRVIKADPVAMLVDKILEEIRGEAKYYLFVRPPRPGEPYLGYLERIERLLRRGGAPQA